VGRAYTGRILRVELNSGDVSVEERSDAFYRMYLGGKGIAGRHLLREIPNNADPLGPENALVFATGVLAGTNLPGFSRVVVAAKSPLTGGYGESEVGGSWGAELKRAGYDAVVITGRSYKPVYLEITRESAALRDASHLWGLTTSRCEAVLAEGFPRKPAVMCIGPAGERLVRYACIMQGDRNAAGRGGLGAVMGSKNLKAVVALGSRRVDLHDAESLTRIARWFAENYPKNPPSIALHDTGTAGLVPGLQAAAMLPTRNFSRGRFDGAESIGRLGGDWVYEVKRRGCFACPIRCKRTFVIPDGLVPSIDGLAACPEYETVAAFGSNMCVDDPSVILSANTFCNEMGLDTISAGVTMSFIMECVESGILKDETLNALGVKFGNAACVLPLLHLIVERRGIGDLLAEGSLRASQKIGGGSEAFAIHVKGQELPMHDPRGKVGVGLGYAVADHGADHMTAAHDAVFAKADGYGPKTCGPLGLTGAVSPLSLGHEKVRLYMYLQMWWDALKCLGACFFCVAPRGLLPVNMVVDAVRAATGWDYSLWEAMKAGDRAGCMARAFNTLHGHGAERDRLPSRLFSSSGDDGYAGIDPDEFDAAVHLYYEMRGWDRTSGVPGGARLHELGLDWVAEGLDAR